MDRALTTPIDGQKYDRVYVGTAMIPVLDAIHHSRVGESVLMIDNQPAMGGAWRSLDAFGLHNVENAIHYLLPEREASRFMKETLGWSIVDTPRKYRVFPLAPFGRIRVRYDSFLGRVLGRAVETCKTRDLLGVIARLPAALREVWADARDPSYYVDGGSPEMLGKVRQMLESARVEIAYSTHINRISFDRDADEVLIHTSAGLVRASTCVISHGTKVTDLEGQTGKLDIVQQVHPRPAAHMLIRDPSPPLIYEAVFTGDPILKYAHDVTRFTRESAAVVGNTKVIVFALRNDVLESDAVYEYMFRKLKWSGMLGPDAVLEDRFWSNIFLPTIDDDDLATIKAAFRNRIDYLRTENFSAGIGYYAPRWAQSFSGQARATPIQPTQQALREDAQ
jgi:hypothetical protein